jgi:hypothetical protein
MLLAICDVATDRFIRILYLATSNELSYMQKEQRRNLDIIIVW